MKSDYIHQALEDQLAHTYCSLHKTDICIQPCKKCLKLLHTLLEKYNILSDIEV